MRRSFVVIEFLGLKVLEKSNLIKKNINMINQYINKYKSRLKRMINAG